MIIVVAAACTGPAWICENAALIDAGSKIGTFVIALLAVIVTYFSFRTNRRAQLFANAVQMYRRYLELAVAHPTLAEPDEYPPITDPIEFGRYEWFLGVLIRACEEILEYRPTLNRERAEEWRRTVESLLRNHRKYFVENEWFNSFGKTIYTREFVEFVERVKATKK